MQELSDSCFIGTGTGTDAVVVNITLNFVMLTAFLFSSISSKAPIRVSVYNPEWDHKKWSEYPNLRNIELLLRRVGDVQWQSALNPSGNRIYFSKRPPKVEFHSFIMLFSCRAFRVRTE